MSICGQHPLPHRRGREMLQELDLVSHARAEASQPVHNAMLNGPLSDSEERLQGGAVIGLT
jgi:hypothetical protein